MPGDAMILVNEDGKFDLLEKGKGTVLGDLGMLTDAFPVDYNSDGLTDILVTGEWMPLTFLIQDESGFNSKVEIPNSLGWWNFIHPKDMNGDGKEDYVLGNLGLNIKYKASQEEPFFVYAKDFDENGTFDIVLGSSKGESRFPVRGRQCSSEQVPEIKEKFPTYDLFAKATVEEIYSKEELQNALKYEAVHFENSILYSGKEGFELKKLPNYAQISAGMDALSYDVDENGEMDLILVGNLEEMEVETPRADASHGILLLQKNGEFHSDPAYYNLGLSGNVRAASEINVNGKKCIIVARNNGKLSLIRRPELK